MMEDGVYLYWKFMVVAVSMGLILTGTQSGVPVRVNIYKRIKREVVSYSVSLAPMALLCYTLYLVSFRF